MLALERLFLFTWPDPGTQMGSADAGVQVWEGHFLWVLRRWSSRGRYERWMRSWSFYSKRVKRKKLRSSRLFCTFLAAGFTLKKLDFFRVTIFDLIIKFIRNFISAFTFRMFIVKFLFILCYTFTNNQASVNYTFFLFLIKPTGRFFQGKSWKRGFLIFNLSEPCKQSIKIK